MFLLFQKQQQSNSSHFKYSRAIWEVLMGLELKKNPNAIFIILTISHQAKIKNTYFHVSGQARFFSNEAARLFDLLYSLTLKFTNWENFPVSFLCLRSFTVLHHLVLFYFDFFVHTSHEGVQWLLISWNMFLKRKNILKLQFLIFTNGT